MIFISIATYNEQENIEKLIREIFDLQIKDLNIVVIDDNSPDGTSQTVENLKNEFSSLHLITRKNERGLGSAMITGFKFALDNGADIIISIDADFSHPPKDISRLIEAINSGADMAIASRKIKGGRVVGWNLWRKFCSTGVMIASKLILGVKTNDVSTDFRAYTKNVLRKINLDNVTSKGYSFVEELLYLIEKDNFKVKEIPSTFINRQEGKSKSSLKEIIPFFITLFKIRLRNFKLNFENSALIILGISFFIGIWHAFPLLNIIDDEMYFVGGVLRAMENFTIFPAVGDVPYGTITYFLNYGLIGIVILIMLSFFKFDVSVLKDYLIQSPELMYFIPRILSAVLGIVALLVINKLLKREIKDIKSRIFLLVLVFTNMLTVLMFHTGKMWVLSTLLVIISFYYLYRALTCQQDNEKSLCSRSIFLSILFSFLAVANFAFYVIFLINIPLIVIFFWKQKELKIKIIKYILIGFVILILLTLTNFSSVTDQVVYHATEQADIYQTAGNIYQPVDGADGYINPINSFFIYLQRIFVFFPLLLLTLLFVCFDKIKNKKLLIISLVYFLVYYVAMAFITKQSLYLHSNIRYSFPFVFFLIFIIISFNIKFKKIFYLFGLISIIFFVFTLYYLSIPTTYNLAYDWTIKNLNQENIVIFNNVPQIQLPKNKKSYSLVQDYFCASKCQNVKTNNLNNHLNYLIIDQYVREDVLPPDNLDQYYLSDNRFNDHNYELITSFLSGTDTDFSLDVRMGNYFDLRFFQANRFGPDVYIYKKLK